MAWTQDDADALRAAIASGARRVAYSDGSEIEYRTLAEMEAILSKMVASLSTTKTVRAFRGTVNSGY